MTTNMRTDQCCPHCAEHEADTARRAHEAKVVLEAIQSYLRDRGDLSRLLSGTPAPLNQSA
jgi:hypothetical protein